MITYTHTLCNASMSVGYETEVNVSGHTINLHHYLRIKRVNKMLNTEVGLWQSISQENPAYCWETLAKFVCGKLTTRTPIDRVRELLDAFWHNFHEYNGPSGHDMFCRGQLDTDWGDIRHTQLDFDEYSFITINILGKIITDGVDLDDWVLLLQEACFNLLLTKDIEDFPEFISLFNLPEYEPKDNVVNLH